jgi:hypothetical protein
LVTSTPPPECPYEDFQGEQEEHRCNGYYSLLAKCVF